jgi:hypothetical protein
LTFAVLAVGFTAGACASAQAYSAYTGDIQPASNTATAYGYVDTTNVATDWTFAYGPTTHYGLFTSPGTIDAGQGTVLVAAVLTGLTPRTLYHYQLIAIPVLSSRPVFAWAVTGSDGTFRTLGAPVKPGHARRRARPQRAAARRSH